MLDRKAGKFACGALVSTLLMTLATGAAKAADDTAQLPRIAGAREVYASVATPICGSPAGLAETAVEAGKPC